MNFYAIIIIGNHLFVGGAYTDSDCQAQLDSVKSDPALAALSPQLACVTEDKLPRIADQARKNECVFDKRAELPSGAHIVSFICGGAPKKGT